MKGKNMNKVIAVLILTSLLVAAGCASKENRGGSYGQQNYDYNQSGGTIDTTPANQGKQGDSNLNNPPPNSNNLPPGSNNPQSGSQGGTGDNSQSSSGTSDNSSDKNNPVPNNPDTTPSNPDTNPAPPPK
jgi:hypothetical protein